MDQPKALLLIDLQNDYFPGGDFELVRIGEASTTAAAILDRFRNDGRPVFHVRHEFPTADAPFFRPGSTGAAIHPSVAPLARAHLARL